MATIFQKKQMEQDIAKFQANIKSVQSGFTSLESNNFIPLQGAINEAKRSFDAGEELYTAEDIQAMVDMYQSLVTSLKTALGSFVEFNENGTVKG